MIPARPTGEVPTLRVRLSTTGPIGWITLARAEKRNALSPETVRQLSAALEAAGRDESVRVIVLAAEGSDFCAGADLDSLATLADAPDDVHRSDARAFAAMLRAMRTLPKPIIAAVQGRALGGGAGLVTACDIAIAADDAALGYPEVRIGFVAAIVMPLLRSAVAEKTAFELVASGRSVPAAEAARIGLVTRTVPAADLRTAVRQLAEELASLPAEALARTKRLFYEVAGVSFSEALDRGVEANVAARNTAAFREGLSSFLTRQRKAES